MPIVDHALEIASLVSSSKESESPSLQANHLEQAEAIVQEESLDEKAPLSPPAHPQSPQNTSHIKQEAPLGWRLREVFKAEHSPDGRRGTFRRKALSEKKLPDALRIAAFNATPSPGQNKKKVSDSNVKLTKDASVLARHSQDRKRFVKSSKVNNGCGNSTRTIELECQVVEEDAVKQQQQLAPHTSRRGDTPAWKLREAFKVDRSPEGRRGFFREKALSATDLPEALRFFSLIASPKQSTKSLIKTKTIASVSNESESPTLQAHHLEQPAGPIHEESLDDTAPLSPDCRSCASGSASPAHPQSPQNIGHMKQDAPPSAVSCLGQRLREAEVCRGIFRQDALDENDLLDAMGIVPLHASFSSTTDESVLARHSQDRKKCVKPGQDPVNNRVQEQAAEQQQQLTPESRWGATPAWKLREAFKVGQSPEGRRGLFRQKALSAKDLPDAALRIFSHANATSSRSILDHVLDMASPKEQSKKSPIKTQTIDSASNDSESRMLQAHPSEQPEPIQGASLYETALISPLSAVSSLGWRLREVFKAGKSPEGRRGIIRQKALDENDLLDTLRIVPLDATTSSTKAESVLASHSQDRKKCVKPTAKQLHQHPLAPHNRRGVAHHGAGIEAYHAGPSSSCLVDKIPTEVSFRATHGCSITCSPTPKPKPTPLDVSMLSSSSFLDLDSCSSSNNNLDLATTVLSTRVW